MNGLFTLTLFSTVLVAGAEPDLWSAPVHRSGTITNADYPEAALRDGAEGNSTIELAVDGAGRVTACRIKSSSGHAALDAAACDLAHRRFRFTPALDRRGAPREAVVLRTIWWLRPLPPKPSQKAPR